MATSWLCTYSSTTYSWKWTINNFTTHGKNLLLHKTHFFRIVPSFIAYSRNYCFSVCRNKSFSRKRVTLLYMHYAWRHWNTIFAKQDGLTKAATFPEQTIKYMIAYPRDQVGVLHVHWLPGAASRFHNTESRAIALAIVSSEFSVVQMVTEAGLRISRDHILGRRSFQHYRTLLKLYSHLGLHSDTLYPYFFHKWVTYTSFLSVRVKRLRKG